MKLASSVKNGGSVVLSPTYLYHDNHSFLFFNPFKILCYTLFISLSFATIIFADEFVSRKVLAVYDEVNPIEPYGKSPFHRHLEFAFNYLGYIAEPHDLKQFKPVTSLSEYSAVVAFFTSDTLSNGTEYFKWLNQIADSDTKIILVGKLGHLFDLKTKRPVPDSLIENFFKKWGVSYLPPPFNLSGKVESLFIDSLMMGYETKKLNDPIQNFLRLKNLNTRNKVYWTYQLQRFKQSPTDAVLIHPDKGGYALGDFIMLQKPFPQGGMTSKQTIWFLNPFAFIQKIMGVNSWPIPDIATANGNRVLYSHVDGDGFINQTFLDKDKLCGEIIIDSIFKKFDIPVSVSFIGAELNPKFFGNRKSLKVAQQIAALPQIEIASHTFSHPFVYSQAHMDYFKDIYKENFYLPVKNYTPTAYNEVMGSIEYLNKIQKGMNKESNMIFWSGNCLPDTNYLKIAFENQILNINGGDPRFDSKFPSMSSLAPFTKKMGDYRQIYTSNANETIYTDVWTGPFYGYTKVLETIKNTDNTYFLRPIDVYYHFYSLDRPAGYFALQKVLNEVTHLEVTPIFTSDYIKSVNSFFDIEIQQNAPHQFTLTNSENLRSLRLKDTSKVPDINLSRNILGFRKMRGELYLYLGGQSTTLIVLNKNSKTPPFTIYESNAWIKSFTKTDSTTQFLIQSFGETHFQFYSNPECPKPYFNLIENKTTTPLTPTLKKELFLQISFNKGVQHPQKILECGCH